MNNINFRPMMHDDDHSLYRPTIRDNLATLLTEYATLHSKTMVIRFDVTYPKMLALPGFPWVADLLMSFPEGTNEGYGPIFSDSRADRALVC